MGPKNDNKADSPSLLSHVSLHSNRSKEVIVKAKDLMSMTVTELQAIAKKRKVKLSSKLRKAEIISALTTTESATEEAPSKKVSPLKERRNGQRRNDSGLALLSPEVRIEASKYDVTASHSGAEATPRGTGGEAAILPEGYGTDRVGLMARDPYWAHAYWEVTHPAIEKTREILKDPDARLALRVYDASDLGPHGFPISLFDIEVFQRIGSWYVELGRPDRAFFVEIGMKDRAGVFHSICRSNTVNTPRDRISDVTDVEWSITGDDFQKLFALSGGYGIGLSSAELTTLMAKRFREEITSPGVSSPGAWSLFSPGRPSEIERGFWFWVNAELIVYGATEPDASVTFQGKPIELRPDGTFSMRFALPDGVQVMPIRATSADRMDDRVITPIVSRETK